MKKSLTATEARNQWFDLLRNSIKGHRVYHINSKEGGAVLLSEEDYDSLLETLELLSTPGLLKSVKQAEKDIKEGNIFTLDEVLGDQE